MSGRIITRLGGLPQVIYHLTFSHDGQFLAASLGSDGIRVYRTSDWSEYAQDQDYNDLSASSHFAVDGRLVTTSFDSDIRLYNSRFERIAKTLAPGGQQPVLARFSPDGKRIAVGFADSTEVNVLSGEDLRLLYIPDTTGVNNSVMAVVEWSQDGHHLYAAGQYADGNSRYSVRVWENGGRGSYRDVPLSDNTILDLKALSDDGLAFGTFDPMLGVLLASGSRRWVRDSVIADYRALGEGFRVADDGKTIQFAYRYGGKASTIDLCK